MLAMKGRFHYYEGYDISQVVFHIRVFGLMGISGLIVTNAAGGINTSFRPGDLMLITDHISFFAPSPLRGRNLDEFGPRFPDMCEAYDRSLIEYAEGIAESMGIELKKGSMRSRRAQCTRPLRRYAPCVPLAPTRSACRRCPK